MTLMKLRLNRSHVDLGIGFPVSTTTIMGIIRAWIPLLYDMLFHGLLAEGVPSFCGTHLDLCLHSPS